MTGKKKENKKEEITVEAKVDERDAIIQQLQTQIQSVVNTANEYIALCNHYEKTTNILTGRVQEVQSNLTAVQQQQQQQQ